MNYAIFISIAIYGCIQDMPYGIARSPSEPKLGNHWAVIKAAQKADAMIVDIPWRRRDLSPERKDIIIFNSATGKQIANVKVVEINREHGRIIFQPDSAGEYYVYYMPYTADTLPWGYKTEYTLTQDTADPEWLAKLPEFSEMPCAEVIEIQAKTEFDRFDPMEVIATADEVKNLVEANKAKTYLLFPEDRKYPIRMTDDLPLRWIRKGPCDDFSGEAQRGEFYVFQIGVYPAKSSIEDIDILYTDLRSDEFTISADQFYCFNKSGTDWLGREIRKEISIKAGKVGALWFGIQITEDAQPGVYSGILKLNPKNAEESKVSLSLTVSNDIAVDNGCNELWKQSRLKWLDSRIGLDDEVTEPYIPLKIKDNAAECLGRSITLSNTGLPESIKSNEREILESPIKIIIETGDGQIKFSESRIKLIKESPGTAIWNSTSRGDVVSMECETRMEFDGFINFRISLDTHKAMDVKDIHLDMPIRREVATYMMGMGCKGGYRQKEWKWAWDEKLANNCIWIGDVDAGIYCKLKGTEDIWELYSLKASGIPKDWSNSGRGGCMVFENGDQVILRAFSGERIIRQGEKMDFCFSLLITPLKPLSPAHWDQRYYHAYVPINTVRESGANIVNIHHGNDINPNINYPFIKADKMASYIKEAHENGIRVKIYYTIRELSNYTAEIWALRSLGREIFTDGSGGGHSWLREHLVSHYASAWHHTFSDTEVDAAIATTGLSRWHNYYLEGLRWLVKNVGIDGLYLDGIGYDREIMKRVRKVMDREHPGCLIDFHSGNNFHPQYGLSNCATQYMEHFPYIDSLWFGEGYDYDETPDYWLVEISGIPFGLFSEMLQSNGNPWRGMVYGMTNRLGWGGDPRQIWKLWDQFGIHDAQMIGYWKSGCPVKTDNRDVFATVYRKVGKSLISIASWAKETVNCRLNIDWEAIGLDSKKAELLAPAIPGFQPLSIFDRSDPIPIEPGRGWLIIVSEC